MSPDAAVVLDLSGTSRRATLRWTGAQASADRPLAPVEIASLPEGGFDLCSECCDLLRLEARAETPVAPEEIDRLLRIGGEVTYPVDTAQAHDPIAAALQDLGYRIHQDGTRVCATKTRSRLTAAPEAKPLHAHRAPGYALLSGAGLEIGAFNEPAPLPEGCGIRYFDVIDTATARARFPEIDPRSLVEVEFTGDIDRGGLAQFRDGQFDFVICNHVIEHLANPIALLRELFRIVVPGGLVVLAVPDKRFTFDFERDLTSWEHLAADYAAGTVDVSDEHYWDFLRKVAPHLLQESPEARQLHLERARTRREHVHVWDSDSFQAFVQRALALLNIRAEQRYASAGETNRIEFFGVWQTSRAAR